MEKQKLEQKSKLKQTNKQTNKQTRNNNVISPGDLARPPPFSESDPNEQRSKPVADIPLNPDWFIFRDPYFGAEIEINPIYITL